MAWRKLTVWAEFPCYRLTSTLLTGGTYADSMPLPSPLASEVIVNYAEKQPPTAKAGILVPEKMRITGNNRDWLAETGSHGPAPTPNQSFRTAQTVVDWKQAVSAGIFAGSIRLLSLCGK